MAKTIYFTGIKNFRPTVYLVVFIIALVARTASAETPEHFAHNFADFKFVFHAEVQEPKVFLATKSGDCDDFATLAADVLKKSGYSPRLVAIRMKKETHVVCFIPEVNSYLDYNNRAAANPLVPSDGSLTDIATKVAHSFGRNWVSVYEFTYRQKIKWLVNSILPNQKNPENFLAKK